MSDTPTTQPDLLDPRTLAQIQSLELRARRIVEGYVSGAHRSPYHGFSIEFAEHREYSPGDDLRHVDWKVFGRTDKFYLKQYEDETNLIGYMVVDVSESMQYQSEGAAMSKLQFAQTAAAALSWLVLQHQDAAGLATFGDQLRSLITPASGAAHLSQIVHTLEKVEARQKTSLGPIFHDLAQRLTKRGVVVILSDLFDDVATMLAGLKHFQHRRHDVIVLHVLDPAELDFPFHHMTMFQGLEQFPEVLADPRSLRKAYLSEFNQFLREVKAACRAQQIDYHLVRTDDSFAMVMARFLATRMARQK